MNRMFFFVFCIFAIVLLSVLMLLYVLILQWSETVHKYVDQHIVAVAERTERHKNVLLDHDSRLNVTEALVKELLLLSKPDRKAIKRLDTVNLNDESV